MAECHPVAFRFVTRAKARGATIIHVDPRFNRTSALADHHLPIRAGTDIAFLGGLIRYVIEHEKYFADYVRHYTNAANLISDDFLDTEDLDGLFSGFDSQARNYDSSSWRYAGHAGQGGEIKGSETEGISAHAGKLTAHFVQRDESLQDPRCVFQIVRRHFQRYTPEMVSQICGISVEQFLTVAEALTENSGRPDKTAAFCYAVGWTQHTTGVQIIRTAGILQLLLGNMGRPGGGIMALRGHASIQGSTDIPTLYNLLPGYLDMPDAREPHATLEEYLREKAPLTGWWHNMAAYMVSLLKAWYGAAATAENGYGYDLLAKINGNHSQLPMTLAMKDGTIKGLFLLGQNPAVGGQNTRVVREGLRNLDWLVVRDFFEIESASFWKDAPEVKRGEVSMEEIQTEVLLFPAAGIPEKEGTLTNTQRLLQWHDKAVAPPGDCTTEPWFIYKLGQRLKELYADSTDEGDRPLQALTWDYPTDAHGEPEIEAILREINGYELSSGRQLDSYSQLRADGSTACGCWIYSGVLPSDGVNRARQRGTSPYRHLDWGFAWPSNRRILYNRASAAPDGTPWHPSKRLVWWDESTQQWAGYDVPDFPRNKAPDYQPTREAVGDDALAGDAPFIIKEDGLGWLFAPTGLADGPLPTHYEPIESPADNPLYAQQHNPVAERFLRPDNPQARRGSERFPYVITTYRLTEHHTAGGMSRWAGTLAELQPELFAEISPELAEEKGIENGGWLTVSTPRGKIEARALVTARMTPLTVNGKAVHTVGLPWHWGFAGLAQGDVVNDLSAIVADPNVSIHEGKVFTCNIWPGRKRRKG